MTKLLELAEAILDARDRGLEAGQLLEQFERLVPYPRARELFISDRTATDIVERARSFRRVAPGPGQRAELLELVGRIRRFEGGELGVDIAEDCLRASVPHPDVSGLLADGARTDEDVVDEALNYTSLRLP